MDCDDYDDASPDLSPLFSPDLTHSALSSTSDSPGFGSSMLKAGLEVTKTFVETAKAAVEYSKAKVEREKASLELAKTQAESEDGTTSVTTLFSKMVVNASAKGKEKAIGQAAARPSEEKEKDMVKQATMLAAGMAAAMQMKQGKLTVEEVYALYKALSESQDEEEGERALAAPEDLEDDDDEHEKKRQLNLGIKAGFIEEEQAHDERENEIAAGLLLRLQGELDDSFETGRGIGVRRSKAARPKSRLSKKFDNARSRFAYRKKLTQEWTKVKAKALWKVLKRWSIKYGPVAIKGLLVIFLLAILKFLGWSHFARFMDVVGVQQDAQAAVN
ncbi:hypothetical protein CALCODRAFT_544008 [Calocera cornea HHB12733]|uniref:Uncharacterized protein n=1 Tax=Calocera cornea HHB12733 TaxID=1353952 RepID=A0A165F7K6_9BASI|nr:hypothetical protein CALCODRAFT_544008 [Calocera cornea HHB12733]